MRTRGRAYSDALYVCLFPQFHHRSETTGEASLLRIRADLTGLYPPFQLLLGLLLLVFGVLALLQGSSQAYLGGGLWGGVCVIVCGTLGIMSSRRPCTYFYLVCYGETHWPVM